MSAGQSGIIDFFKDMIGGKLAGGQISNKLPFHLIISTVRRKKMLNSLMSGDWKERQEGEKVLNSYARYLSVKKQKDLNESDLKEKPTPTPKKSQNSSRNIRTVSEKQSDTSSL